MSLDRAHKQLGWPKRKAVLEPKGAGSRVMLAAATEKLRRALIGHSECEDLSLGLLVPQLSTTSPVALVCEFKRVPSEEVLGKVHRFAWNLCQAPLLLTVDPVCVRAWSCCEPPPAGQALTTGADPEIVEATVKWKDDLQSNTAEALEWINLAWGAFFTRNESRFPTKGRADALLVTNLKAVRAKLGERHLSHELAHDLLGRLIFIQFLFQRKDKSGYSALSASVLERLFQEGSLSKSYETLGDILVHKGDTYLFFRWLNRQFNGDLFPGSGESEPKRENSWRQEMTEVKPEHLSILAHFVRGDLEFNSGQMSLFPLYSFDTIPLDFISNVYQEFIGEEGRAAGGHYTPSHVVDLMLDEVLPWNGVACNLKILDPACGSGIFLVKAFQRLVHRWKRKHGTAEIGAARLKKMLEEQLCGVDINREAIRVASFSLYLALCDQIEPRYYWKHVRFPSLINRRLIHGDIFDELTSQKIEVGFDIVVGNAPWGQNSATKPAKAWADRHGWEIPDANIGTLFVPRSASSCRSNARISLLQPLGLLVNSGGPSQNFRNKFFATFSVEQVINLAALRFNLFSVSVAPLCIVTLTVTKPKHAWIEYLCPKPTGTSMDSYSVTIDESDAHEVALGEAADLRTWAALMWGGRRDAVLLRRLRDFTTLADMEKAGRLHAHEGIIRGKSDQKPDARLLNRRLLEADREIFLSLDPETLPVNRDPMVHRVFTDLNAFELPQLILKQGWTKRSERFAAALIEGEGPGVLCTQSFVSIHADKDLLNTLRLANLVYNSTFAVYYSLLTNARFASYRPELLVSDCLSIPLPNTNRSFDDHPHDPKEIDELVRDLYGFNDAEWTSIVDTCKYALGNFRGGKRSIGRRATTRSWSLNGEPDELSKYASTFINVLQSAFGEDKPITATIFEDPVGAALPARLLAIHLIDRERAPGTIGSLSIDSRDLLKQLREVSDTIVAPARPRAIIRNRSLRLYHSSASSEASPTVFLMKPDQKSHWSKSAAMRDADSVAADIMIWGASR